MRGVGRFLGPHPLCSFDVAFVPNLRRIEKSINPAKSTEAGIVCFFAPDFFHSQERRESFRCRFYKVYPCH